MNNKAVVIVNAISTGKLLAKEFIKHGYQCIHILPALELQEGIKEDINLNEFICCLEQKSFKNENEIAKKLLSLDCSIKHVIPGADSGVRLAGVIANCLSLNQNDPKKLLARCSKYHMQNTLFKSGIDSTKQIKTSTIKEAKHWYDNNFKDQAVVVKPEYGCRSDGVHLCQSAHAVEHAFLQELDRVNCVGYHNKALVMQEYLHGPEYIVNTMSIEGQHFVTDIWLGFNNGKQQISVDFYAQLITASHPHHHALTNYAKAVLVSLGLNSGPAHLEIKFTPRGPVLIEIGARLPGLMSQKSIKKVLGVDLVELTIAAVTQPSRALKLIKQLGRPKFARHVYFNSTQEGKILSLPDASQIEALDSCNEVMLLMKKGGQLHNTVTIPGRQAYAYFISDNEAQVENDYQRFLELEKIFYKKMLC
jgi:biotin carboxylase